MDLFRSFLRIFKRVTVGWTWYTQWTGVRNNQMIISVVRQSKSKDGIFGLLTILDNSFKCVTLENLDKEIPVGVYNVDFTYSPHFGKRMPHIIVPVRDEAAGGDAGIRFHPANWPSQLEGCIALGSRKDGDAIDDSADAFKQFFAIIDGNQNLIVKVTEDYGIA